MPNHQWNNPSSNSFALSSEEYDLAVPNAASLMQSLRAFGYDIVDHLLHRFVLAGRIFRNSERVACNADWLSNGNPAYEMAFWALLDFRDSVEYQLPGNHGITISAFTENGEYDFVSVLPGHEKSTSDVVQAQREALGQRLVIVVQNPDQIPLITIRPVAAYCVVSPDGKTTYYTTAKEAAPCQPPTSAS